LRYMFCLFSSSFALGLSIGITNMVAGMLALKERRP